jgi:hypothetical protein
MKLAPLMLCFNRWKLSTLSREHFISLQNSPVSAKAYRGQFWFPTRFLLTSQLQKLQKGFFDGSTIMMVEPFFYFHSSLHQLM